MQKPNPPISRRTFFKGLGGWIASHWLLSSTLIGGGGVLAWTSHDTLTLKKEVWDLYYPELPSQLNGKTIVQLSDLHLENLPLAPEKISAAVNSVSPDLLVLTGDLISERSDLTKVAAYLQPLQAPLGKYMVMGNNDYSHFSRTLFMRYQELLGTMGWVPLINDSEFLSDLNLWVIGIDDPATAHDDVDKAYSKLMSNPSRTSPSLGLASHPPSSSSASTPSPLSSSLSSTSSSATSAPFRLVLAHSTDCLDGIYKYGAELFLTGHTHGGQVRLPGMKPFVTNTFLGDQGIYEGYHVIEGIPLYINRGIGESGIPIRINVPPEIAVFRLHKGQGDPKHTTI